MNPLPLPTSLEEVQRLIQALYSPNPPETIATIQEVLQRLQKSEQGWQLAQSLISNPDNNIKFFAALTLIVKLNKENANLSEDDAKELLQNIVGWLLQAMTDGTQKFVIKKLCSALVTHFLYFSGLWPKCLRQLVYCLDIGRSAAVEAQDDALQTGILIQGLDARKMWVAIQFATALVEEVGKTDMNSQKFLQVHDRLVSNAPDVVSLLIRGFDRVAEGYSQESLACYQAWILYAQRISGNTELLVNPLRQLVEPAMKCFLIDDLYQETAGLFSDVLQNYSGFFTEEHYSALFSLFDTPWAAQLYDQLREDTQDQDGMSYGLLLLAYGDAKVQDLMTSTDQRSQKLLDRLVGLLGANGYLVGEDSIFVPSLEFWSTFVETMIDTTYSEEDGTHAWRPYADQHLKNVVMNSWRKIQWPPAEKFAEWDSSERLGFGDARKDVGDMLQSIFTLNGVTLISFFVDLFHQSLQSQSWAEVEASAFCLGALSDCVTEEPKYDSELSKVFSTPFFELLGEARGPIPLRLRQTGLSLIERYCEYFERHSAYLPHALNLLFAAVGDSVLGAPSARSISTLCSSCRALLTGEAEAFIRHYQTIRNGQTLDSIAEEKIVHAIAAIIQAIPEEELRLRMFEGLYSFIQQDVERAVQLKANPSILNLLDPNFSRGLENWKSPQPIPPSDEISLQIALRALRCLSSMAKGMQDTKEHIVELDAEVTVVPTVSGLAKIQVEIIRLLAEVQRIFNKSGEVTETICNIFRAGFSETEPGPFVFPPEVVASFFVQQAPGTPRLGTILSTACSFVGSLYRGPRTYVPNYLAQLLPWVISTLQALSEPEDDAEISQEGIALVDRIMPKYPEVVFRLHAPLLEFFFLFTLKVLNGKEPLPKFAAADFWSNFISLKSQDPNLQTLIANAVDHLGPIFTQTLVNNIGGNAARSELDKLSDPLKKLVVQQPSAQQWLERALFGEGFPGGQVTPEEKMVFLKKIIALRGGWKTKEVVREFWLACRGSNFTYVS
ncbi:hypothetical protein OQA88_125 [Cercophora sp. LCS_1]